MADASGDVGGGRRKPTPLEAVVTAQGIAEFRGWFWGDMSPWSSTDSQGIGKAPEAGPYEPAVSTKGCVCVSTYAFISICLYI